MRNRLDTNELGAAGLWAAEAIASRRARARACVALRRYTYSYRLLHDFPGGIKRLLDNIARVVSFIPYLYRARRKVCTKEGNEQ